jgi:hypothetical protein
MNDLSIEDQRRLGNEGQSVRLPNLDRCQHAHTATFSIRQQCRNTPPCELEGHPRRFLTHLPSRGCVGDGRREVGGVMPHPKQGRAPRHGPRTTKSAGGGWAQQVREGAGSRAALNLRRTHLLSSSRLISGAAFRCLFGATFAFEAALGLPVSSRRISSELALDCTLYHGPYMRSGVLAQLPAPLHPPRSRRDRDRRLWVACAWCQRRSAIESATATRIHHGAAAALCCTSNAPRPKPIVTIRSSHTIANPNPSIRQYHLDSWSGREEKRYM